MNPGRLGFRVLTLTSMPPCHSPGLCCIASGEKLRKTDCGTEKEGCTNPPDQQSSLMLERVKCLTLEVCKE